MDMLKRIGAAFLLILLLVLPFVNWRAGATLWLCAGMTYVCIMVLGDLSNKGED